MCEEQGLNPELQAVEAALDQARPGRAGLDRDLLMFNAGRASVRPNRPWQALSGVLAVLLLCSVCLRPNSVTPRPSRPPAGEVDAGAYVKVEPASPLGQRTYLRLRQQVLEEGLESLPEDPGGQTAPLDRRESLTRFLSS